MKLLLKLLLLCLVCLKIDVMGMLIEENLEIMQKFLELKSVPVYAYGGGELDFPISVVKKCPFLKMIILRKLEEDQLPPIAITKKETFCTEESLKFFITLFTNETFERFLEEINKNKDQPNNLVHTALQQIINLDKTYTAHRLWNLILIANFFSIKKEIVNPIIEFLNDSNAQLNLIDPNIIIKQNIIECPITLFDNKLPLFNELIFKENETIEADVCFNPVTKQCIFTKKVKVIIDEKDVEENKKKLQSKMDKLVTSQLRFEKNDTEKTQYDTQLVITNSTQNSKAISHLLSIDSAVDGANAGIAHNDNTIACAIKKKIFIYKMNDLTIDKLKEITRDNDFGMWNKIKFSPDGKWLGIGNGGKGLEIYSTDNYTLRQTIDVCVRNFNFSSNSRKIVCGNSYGELYTYELHNNKYQLLQQYGLKRIIVEPFFISDDSYVYCRTGGESNLAVALDKGVVSFLPHFYATTHDPIQNTMAFAKAFCQIKLHQANALLYPINSRINHHEDQYPDSISTDIKNYNNFTFSPDGNYLVKIDNMRPHNSIQIYHVPVFDRTVKRLSSDQRWFLFFCNYWQRHNMYIPYKHNDLYNKLSDALQIKFKSLKDRGQTIHEYPLYRKEKRRESFIKQEDRRREKLVKDKEQYASFWNRMKSRKNDTGVMLEFRQGPESPTSTLLRIKAR